MKTARFVKTILKNSFFQKKIKPETEIRELVEGHLEKAEHNLKFAKTVLDLNEFNDWVIVATYYSIYHASLALCALRGYSTKDHNATLLIIIKEFYMHHLTLNEIEMVGALLLEKEEVLYYVEAKSKRRLASYSTQKIFDKTEVNHFRIKAIAFIGKVKDIIENEI